MLFQMFFFSEVILLQGFRSTHNLTKENIIKLVPIPHVFEISLHWEIIIKQLRNRARRKKYHHSKILQNMPLSGFLNHAINEDNARTCLIPSCLPQASTTTFVFAILVEKESGRGVCKTFLVECSNVKNQPNSKNNHCKPRANFQELIVILNGLFGCLMHSALYTSLYLCDSSEDNVREAITVIKEKPLMFRRN